MKNRKGEKMKISLGLGKISMEKITEYASGELYNFSSEECYITHICTDSREADENTLFIATKGERVDGHDYILSASDRGCRCFVCEYVPSDISGKPLAFCVVENSVDAFANIGRGYRRQSPIKSVAITGSVGKTTTKELMACVTRECFNTYSTSGNFNSVIGMPMSLMEAGDDIELGVFEMGMSGFSEISSMSYAAEPDVALVVNIGSSHLEYLGTRKNIAKAKLEIADGMKSGGTLILNGDEPLLRNAREITHRDDINYVYTSVLGSEGASYRAENIRLSDSGSVFDMYADGEMICDIEICVPGIHVVNNSLMVLTAAHILGIDKDKMKAGIKKYIPVGDRQRIFEKNGFRIIADCYNAAPESMRAALDVLSTIAKNGRKIAVLGDMKELGKNSDSLHFDVGQYASGKIDVLITVGESASLIADGAQHGGMNTANIYKFGADDISAACEKIKEIGLLGDCLLIKASRSMKLERIIEGL